MPRRLLFLLTATLALAGGAARADDVTVTVHVRDGRHHRPTAVPAWVPPSGQQIYYAHHPSHIPAYPVHLHGLPVPVFPTARPPLAVHGAPVAVVPSVPHAHIAWCTARYRSYRLWDNSFQPYAGPRRQCWSPYR